MNEPRLPERWVRLYTRGLPPEMRDARADEIASDIYEHCASANGNERGVSAAVIGRTLRGVPGDLIWRFEEGRAVKNEPRADGVLTGVRAMWATVTQAWFTPLAVLLGVFNLVAAVWIAAFDSEAKMPGQAIGPIFLAGFAISMFTGLWLRWRSTVEPRAARVVDEKSEARSSRFSAVLLGLAISAIGLIVLGVLTTMLSAVVGVPLLIVVVFVALRRRQARAGAVASTAPGQPAVGEPEVGRGSRSVVLADALIVVGTLPAIGLWWMVVPPLVAVAVIAGVIGTAPGARSRVPA